MIKLNREFTVSNIIIYAIIFLFSLGCILPFIVIVSASLSSEAAIVTKGYGLFPKDFSTQAYALIFSGSVKILNSYTITLIVTIVGTISSVLFTTLVAYPISRRRFKHRNVINFYLFFTMLFNGGTVPWYILCTRYLGLKNNLPALIIPALLSAWFIFLLRNFFSSLPEALEESARIDGAGDYTILFKIFIPLSLPGIATIALFTLLGFWNDWWLGLMLCDGNKIVPLQLYMIRIIQSAEFLKNSVNTSLLKKATVPSETVRMAICVLAIGPVVFAYPFFQKYFIKGLTIGAVKG